MTIELRLLGGLDVYDHRRDGTAAVVGSTKRLAVVAFLAVARPGPFHRREKLLSLFWPWLPADRARAALRTALAETRRDFGNAFLESQGDAIRIADGAVTCDAVALEAAIRESNTDLAVSLFRGPFLDGVHVEGTDNALEDWIAGERCRIRDLFLAHVRTAAVARRIAGDVDGALRIAGHAVALDPVDEATVRLQIELHGARGDRGRAMAAYEALASAMQREYDTAPSDETQRAIARLRTTRPPLPSPAAVAVDATAQRTPDHSAPEPQQQRQAPRRRSLLVTAMAIGAVSACAWVIGRVGAEARADATPMAPEWSDLSVLAGGPPPPRLFGALVVDSTSNALLLIGGLAPLANTGVGPGPLFGDIWRLEGLGQTEARSWRRLRPADGPAPAPRFNALVAYDADRDRVIMHGGAEGHSSPCSNDTWLLLHASGIGATPRWREVRTRGIRPPAHAQAEGFYESRSRTLVAFSGNDCFATYTSDLWMLAFDDTTLTTGHWTRMLPDTSAGAPARRDAAAAAYDRRARRLWVHGGHIGGGRMVSELWRLDHADGSDGQPSWHPVHCAGAAPSLSSHLAVFDTATASLLLFGGTDDDRHKRNDTWIVRGLEDGGTNCAWQRLATPDPAPAPREAMRGASVDNGAAVLVLGGFVPNVAAMDLWRLERPFGRPRVRRVASATAW